MGAMGAHRAMTVSALALACAALYAPAAMGQAAAPSDGGDIVVTARKQSERLQDVPMTVTAVAADKLASVGASKILDILATVPGISAASQTGAPGSISLNIRGISTADASSITVATTLDDVPVNSSSANAYAGYSGLDLLPSLVGGIEILKGPQGTLYGASSLGGLMKYVTPTPSLTETSVEIGGGAAITAHSGQVGTRIYVKGETPIADDTLSLGFAFEQVYTPGYLDNARRGIKDENHGIQRGGRATLYFVPNDNFNIKLNAIVQHTDFNGLSAIQIDPVTQAPLDGYYNSDFPLANGSKQDTQIFSANASLDLGGINITSVTGYSHLKSSYMLDLSRKNYSIALGVNGQDSYTFTTNKFSQELRLSSDIGDNLKWNAGFFYTSEDSAYVENAIAYDKTTGATSSTLNPYYFSSTDSGYKEVAGFGSLEWKITDKLDVNLSGRYSSNRQHAQADTYGVLADYEFFSPVFKSSDSKFTYAVNARYFFNPDVMVYGRIATGYRPGGPNLLLNVPATFKPDTTTNYEIGLKSTLLDRKLVFNLTGFYIEWNDIHTFERQGSLATYTGNGGGARSQGIELMTYYRITPDLRVGLNGGYTDAHLTSAYTALAAPSGFPLPNQAKWSGALTADWSHELSDDSKLNVGATWSYVGPRWSDFPGSNPGGIRLSAYNTVSLNAGVDTGNWSFGVYVRNLADEKAIVTRRNAGAVILQPRTIGVTAAHRF
ncbi:TonB-dependent receptor [Sphingobium sp. CR2-8]|uniref:TonB-dependent receptor n=1 Tax=Sphingobium sp. CR2-8 TaxID=1306534 RepID=UPI002DBAFC94|nr:TonB-dependent receptor [Sphingobium sp. CR2-8]MEC3909447.1 TonB-dependent receptor [Sphingobium sp. CR2-8]